MVLWHPTQPAVTLSYGKVPHILTAASQCRKFDTVFPYINAVVQGYIFFCFYSLNLYLSYGLQSNRTDAKL